MSNHDLDWVAAQRPQRPTDREAHDRALLALLRHATSRPGGRRQAPSLGGLLRPRTLALTTGTGVAAAVAAVSLSMGGGATVTARLDRPSQSAVHAAVRHHAQGSPLVRLADYVGASAAPPGDATLVSRTTTLSANDVGGPETVTVFDLYGDNGTYYFAHDESGLPAQVTGNDNQGGGQFGREVAAAKEAATGNVEQAGMDMAKAPDPNGTINPKQAVNWVAVKQKLELMKKDGDKGAAAQLLAGPSAQGTLYDNWTWEDSQDALIAGAGDPQVRAGVLKILATLPGVSVTSANVDGQPALVLSSGPKETGIGYTEQLTINSQTGMPIRFTGGSAGGPPATTVDYKVARVTLSDVAAGKVPSL